MSEQNFQRQVLITNKLGLHARAATKLAQLCQQYQAQVLVELDGKQVDASSVLGLMLLAGAQGKQVLILTQGEQAEQALNAVCELFSQKFYEQE